MRIDPRMESHEQMSTRATFSPPESLFSKLSFAYTIRIRFSSSNPPPVYSVPSNREKFPFVQVTRRNPELIDAAPLYTESSPHSDENYQIYFQQLNPNYS